MAEDTSLLRRFTTVAGLIGSILNNLDLNTLSREELKLMGTIKHMVADARLDIRDWEMSDSRAEMQANAKAAIHRIEQARASILLASERNWFSAIDIAEISARFDRFVSELRK